MSRYAHVHAPKGKSTDGCVYCESQGADRARRRAASSRSSLHPRSSVPAGAVRRPEGRQDGGTEQARLERKEIALIFEKTSTRTRCSFEVAAYDQGAHVTYLGPEGSQIGHKESMKDTARVLGRIYDGIEYRGFSQENVETLAK